MRNLRLALFIVFIVGTGFAIGLLNPPGSWYAALTKPWFNPPNWVFAPVWAVIYLLVAIAGWRTFERDRNSTAMMLWWVQMALNFVWSPIFFTAHRPDVAFAVILSLLAAILAFITATVRGPGFGRALPPLCGLGRLRIDAQFRNLPSQLNVRGREQLH